MKENRSIKLIMIAVIFLLLLPFATNKGAAAANEKQLVYDFAGLLSKAEINELEAMAHEYGAKRNTDIIILTMNGTQGKRIEQYMEDFYDEKALGYDKPHGNTAILTVDVNMKNRDVYLAGFYNAKKYLDGGRLDQIREKITPDLSSGNYYDAFQVFIKTSYEYMGIKPGINPDLILFNLWFQISFSIVMAGLIVGTMAYHSGGKVTVHGKTYQDENNSGVLRKRDDYIRTTTTKRRKPKENKSGRGSGGSFGGGISRGGHSHSGSRGKF